MAMAASLGTAFLKTHEGVETPDIQFHLQPFSADRVAEGSHKFSAFTASVLQLRPESVGHLELVSADASDYPAIYPNYLATKTDCDTIVAGIKIAREICRTEPVKSMITEEYALGPLWLLMMMRPFWNGREILQQQYITLLALAKWVRIKWQLLMKGCGFMVYKTCVLPMLR